MKLIVSIQLYRDRTDLGMGQYAGFTRSISSSAAEYTETVILHYLFSNADCDFTILAKVLKDVY